MAKIIINWKPFFDNSSSRDALIEFSEGQIKTLTRLSHECWPKECKNEISKMRKIGTKKARIRARRAVLREGWDQ